MCNALIFNPGLYSLLPLNIFQVELEKHDFGFKTDRKTHKYKTQVPKSRFWDVGMEFRDVGCVRIHFVINSRPFSTHSDWKSIKSYWNRPNIHILHYSGLVLSLFPVVWGL